MGTHTISGHGLTATFLELGAILRDLRLEGHDAPLVVGMADDADYPEHSFYMGATAGRVANRIGHARFVLDGTEHRTDANVAGVHTLHGGSEGTGKLPWEVRAATADAIRFGIVLADGHMGFPGRIEIEALFRCEPGATLRVAYAAWADAPTVCNLAHHSYFALDGTGGLDAHVLRVDADRYVTVSEALIPDGVAPVEGTSLDFRAGRRLPGEGLLDHNLCLADARRALTEVAVLRSEASGVEMRLATTAPGLQVYDGAKLRSPRPGLLGHPNRAHAGVALEPQLWPDAPNRPDFPSAVLRPGETYRQTSTFAFSKG